jgi:hypothetical protein
MSVIEHREGVSFTIPRFAFFDSAGSVIETHEHAGDFKEP